MGMAATTINSEPAVHLGLSDLDIWKVRPDLMGVSAHTFKETATESVKKNSSLSTRFLNYLESRQQRGKTLSRSNSLVENSKPSVVKMLLMKRSRSDSYLSLNYKDKINTQKDDWSGAKDTEDVSSEEPFEQGLKLFSCLKAEIGESLQRSERPDIAKVLPRLTTLLRYGGGKVKFETTLFVIDLLPHLGLDVDAFFVKLMPIVLSNLIHSKDSISKVSMELLKTFAEKTNYKNSFVENFISFGLLNKNAEVKDVSIRIVPRLFSEHFTHLDLFHLFQLLVKDLKIVEENHPKRENILNALKHIRYIEGPQEFGRYESMLTPKSGKILRGTTLFDDEEDGEDEKEEEKNDKENRKEDEEEDRPETAVEEGEVYDISSDDEEKLFEVVPREVLNKIANEDAPHLRREGCEELLSFVEWTSSLKNLLPQVGTLLTLLNTFREDADFSVATMSLRVISVLLMRTSAEEVGEYLFPFVLATVLIFSDERFVVRSEANKIYYALLHKFATKIISRNLTIILKHRSSRVRETSINLITSALLTFPRASFDLAFLCMEIVPALSDSKRRVKQAAMECVATLAQALGDRKNSVLMVEVADLEETDAGMGVTLAVRSRLARRALPRLTNDGFVEYWLPTMSAAKRNFSSIPLGSDVDWILSGSGPLSLGSVCEPTSAFLNNSCHSIDFYFHKQTGRETNLSSSLPQHFLLSKMKRENVNSSLHRKRSISAVSIDKGEDDRSPLALWSSEPIDLSRTAPHDFGGYRGVYLGKLRKNSALGRPINTEKSYAILPSKFSSGGVGSARGTDRGGLTSPQISSPVNCRKLNALEPLDQIDSSGGHLGHQSLARMPPLRSGRARSSETLALDKDGKIILKSEDEMFSEEDEEALVHKVLLEKEEPFEEAEEVADEAQNFHENDNIDKKRERSSAETRDSGISIFSPNAEESVVEDSRTSPSSERKKNESERLATEDRVETFSNDEAKSEEKSSGEEDSKEGVIPQEVRRRKMVTIIEPPPLSPRGRNSYDPGRRGLIVPKGSFRRDSTHSLPPSLDARQTPLMAKGKGYASLHSRNKGPFPKAKKGGANGSTQEKLRFKSFDYESDFESEEEDRNGMPTSALTRMKLLKKKRDSMRELEKRLTERDAEKAKEHRIRKYKELEERHSGNSLQITRPSNLDRLSADSPSPARFNKTSLRSSPRENPDAQQRPLDFSLSKNINYDRNLSQGLTSPSGGRTPSLERLETGLTKLPFSRAPLQQKKIIRSTGRAAPLISKTPPSRHSTPGIGLESLTREVTLSEADIPTACFQTPKVLNTIHGNNFRPYKNPKDVYSDTISLLSSSEWEEQVEGIQIVIRLATFHPEVILLDLKEIKLLLMKHAKCLRSQVCRTAIQGITQLFLSLKKQMEPDLEKMVALLLHKTADTNKFLKEDSNCALDAIVEVTTPIKAVTALIQEGIGHRNPQVRTTLGRLLAYSTERLGAAQTISQKDVAEKVFTATTKLVQEGSLETRQMAKLTFQRLATHPQFESALRKYINSEDLKQIQKVIDNIYNESRGGDTSKAKAIRIKKGRFRRTM